MLVCLALAMHSWASALSLMWLNKISKTSQTSYCLQCNMENLVCTYGKIRHNQNMLILNWKSPWTTGYSDVYHIYTVNRWQCRWIFLVCISCLTHIRTREYLQGKFHFYYNLIYYFWCKLPAMPLSYYPTDLDAFLFGSSYHRPKIMKTMGWTNQKITPTLKAIGLLHMGYLSEQWPSADATLRISSANSCVFCGNKSPASHEPELLRYDSQ